MSPGSPAQACSGAIGGVGSIPFSASASISVSARSSAPVSRGSVVSAGSGSRSSHSVGSAGGSGSKAEGVIPYASGTGSGSGGSARMSSSIATVPGSSGGGGSSLASSARGSWAVTVGGSGSGSGAATTSSEGAGTSGLGPGSIGPDSRGASAWAGSSTGTRASGESCVTPSSAVGACEGSTAGSGGGGAPASAAWACRSARTNLPGPTRIQVAGAAATTAGPEPGLAGFRARLRRRGFAVAAGPEADGLDPLAGASGGSPAGGSAPRDGRGAVLEGPLAPFAGSSPAAGPRGSPAPSGSLRVFRPGGDEDEDHGGHVDGDQPGRHRSDHPARDSQEPGQHHHPRSLSQPGSACAGVRSWDRGIVAADWLPPGHGSWPRVGCARGRAQGESVPLAALRTAPTGRGLRGSPIRLFRQVGQVVPIRAGECGRRPGTPHSPPCFIGRAGGGLVFLEGYRARHRNC